MATTVGTTLLYRLHLHHLYNTTIPTYLSPILPIPLSLPIPYPISPPPTLRLPNPNPSHSPSTSPPAHTSAIS